MAKKPLSQPNLSVKTQVWDQSLSTAGLTEDARYFVVPGAHLYTVLHQAKDPVARVLLAGPFASERYFAYHTWVRWARYLAARRIEVLRFDYRGMGESTGIFEEMSFENWSEDVRLLVEWFVNRSPSLPLALHGIELGAIFAGQIFHDGMGDALLLWSPPGNANQVLRSTLRRWAGLEQVYESTENRKSASEYIRQLEQGSSIEVQGYVWSSDLWRDSFQLSRPTEMEDESSYHEENKKPVKIVRFGKDAVCLTMPYLRFDEVKCMTSLYADNFNWIAGALALANWRGQ